MKNVRAWVAGAAAAAMVLPLSVMAAVPAEITSSLSDLKADAITVATAVVVAIVAVYAFKFIRKGL